MTGPGHAGSAAHSALPFPPALGAVVLAVGLVVLCVIGYDIYRRETFGVNA